MVDTNNKFIRTIPHDTPEEDLVWHRDENDRVVEVISGTEWYFQFDNQLPIKLEKDMKLFIGSMKFHRVIRGIDELVIKIEENRLTTTKSIETELLL